MHFLVSQQETFLSEVELEKKWYILDVVAYLGPLIRI